MSDVLVARLEEAATLLRAVQATSGRAEECLHSDTAAAARRELHARLTTLRESALGDVEDITRGANTVGHELRLLRGGQRPCDARLPDKAADFTALAEALRPGDVLRLRAAGGSYAGSPALRHAVTIDGDGLPVVTVLASRPVVVSAAVTVRNVAFRQLAHDVPCVTVTGAGHGAVFEDCSFTAGTTPAVVVADPGAAAETARFVRCTLSAAAAALVVRHDGRAALTDCRVVATESAASPSSRPALLTTTGRHSRLLVEGGDVSGAAGACDGVATTAGAQVALRRASIAGCVNGVVVAGTSALSLADAEVADCREAGVVCEGKLALTRTRVVRCRLSNIVLRGAAAVKHVAFDGAASSGSAQYGVLCVLPRPAVVRRQSVAGTPPPEGPAPETAAAQKLQQTALALGSQLELTDNAMGTIQVTLDSLLKW